MVRQDALPAAQQARAARKKVHVVRTLSAPGGEGGGGGGGAYDDAAQGDEHDVVLRAVRLLCDDELHGIANLCNIRSLYTPRAGRLFS